jgi:hypothetical protein
MLVGAIGALFIHHIQPRLRNDYGPMFNGVTRQKVWKHVLVEGTVLLILLAAMMGAVNHQDATNEQQPSFQLGPGDTVQEILAEMEKDATIITTIRNLDATIKLEYAIISVDLAESGFSDYGVDWDTMQALAVEHCNQQIACNGSLQANESIDLALKSPEVYTFIFFHHPGDEGVIEIQVESNYEHSEQSMTQAVALSLPSLYMTGFVVYRLYRLNNDGRPWYDSRPSHTWEEE